VLPGNGRGCNFLQQFKLFKLTLSGSAPHQNSSNPSDSPRFAWKKHFADPFGAFLSRMSRPASTLSRCAAFRLCLLNDGEEGNIEHPAPSVAYMSTLPEPRSLDIVLSSASLTQRTESQTSSGSCLRCLSTTRAPTRLSLDSFLLTHDFSLVLRMVKLAVIPFRDSHGQQ
jgi:hypothetical protein